MHIPVAALLLFFSQGAPAPCPSELRLEASAAKPLSLCLPNTPDRLATDVASDVRSRVDSWKAKARDVRAVLRTSEPVADPALTLATVRDLTGAASVTWHDATVIPAGVGEETPLLQVIASTDRRFKPQKEEFLGGASGFDRSGYFKTILRGEIRPCLDAVLVAVREWQRPLSANVRLVSVEQGPRRLFVVAYAPEQKGFFRLSYRIAPKLDRFDLATVYVDSSGRSLPLEAIESLLETYQVGRLMTHLEGATACEPLPQR